MTRASVKDPRRKALGGRDAQNPIDDVFGLEYSVWHP